MFYKEWMDAIGDLPDDIRLEIYESVIVYATTGDIGGLKSMAKIAFNFIKADIDRDIERYVAMVEKNKENGARGGRPVKNPKEPKKPTGLSGFSEKPKKADNDNDNDDDLRKKRIKKEAATTDVVTPPPVNSRFGEFVLWQKENAANVLRMKEPISEIQFEKLTAEYSAAQICEILQAMHNWPKLCRNNVSAFLTAKKWLKEDEKRKNNGRAGAGSNCGSGLMLSENERKYGSTSKAKEGILARIHERDLRQNGGITPPGATDS